MPFWLFCGAGSSFTTCRAPPPESDADVEVSCSASTEVGEDDVVDEVLVQADVASEASKTHIVQLLAK
ncbi:hypothetical protein [Mesorhizobium mediterraneum]|uniref:hypothetical protein n=1 Tax=Mesorhizobium mediterraneum TaxID=43617 RepID=UPI001FF0583A|nr:hypothetical protein [Mesorhizobium mediterraneum]